jgi:hypothetical protein
MDEKTAWYCFKHTGNIIDYLIYSQCKHENESMAARGGLNEDGRRGPCDKREPRG